MSEIVLKQLAGSPNLEQLLADINADGGIAPTCEGLGHTPADTNELRVTFDAALSPAEDSALDAVLAAHAPVSHELKLHRYIATNGQDHRQVDYKTGLTARLEKKVTAMVDGEVQEVEYHADEDFDDLVIKVAVFKDQALTTPGYARTSNGLAVERWTERTWYREDGTAHPDTKVTHKAYSHDALQQMREGRRRRSNVIDQLSITVLNLLVATETAVDPLNPTPAEITAAEAIAIPWLATYDDHVNNYIRVGDLAWKTTGTPNLTDDTATWLDNDCEPVGYPASTTIRDVILGSLNEVS
jgi:hypothetical protein